MKYYFLAKSPVHGVTLSNIQAMTFTFSCVKCSETLPFLLLGLDSSLDCMLVRAI